MLLAHLTGAAADWWYSTARGTVKTLEEFVVAVNGRFKSAVDADVAAEKLNQLKQAVGPRTEVLSRGNEISTQGRLDDCYERGT